MRAPSAAASAGVDVGIVEQHLEVERAQQLEHAPADVRRADDADHLAVVAETGRLERPEAELAQLAVAALQAEDALVGEQDGGERVLGDRHGVGRRRRAHLQAALPARLGDVQLHRAGGVHDGAQARRRVEDVRRRSAGSPSR